MAYIVASLLLTLVISLVGSAPSADPCLDGNHVELNQPDRSTAYQLAMGGSGRSDESITKDWYRFTSGAGGEIPTTVPKPGQCNSKKPIWINGTQPALDGTIHTLDMCYSLSDYDPCGIKLQIRAKACINYVVYELVPTSSANSTQQIYDATYCAGEEKLCPAGQSSLTGFTPNCYVAPTVSARPVIDIVEHPDTFEFHCKLGNQQPQAAYKLIWQLDQTVIHEEELQLGADTSKLLESQMVLPGRQAVLGRNLTCLARGRYLAEPKDHWGAALSSDPYFAGIEVSDASGLPLNVQSFTLTLPENDEHQTINIRSTIPVRCNSALLGLTGHKCKILIAIRNDNSMDTKPLRCKNGVVEQLKLATCSVTITPDNWSVSQSISIRATKDFKYDGERSRIIEFNMTEGLGRSVWDGYVPHPITVVTEDFRDDRAMCSSVNDPHMTTFDGHKWHNYFEGEFVLYRHTELPFEVRAFYKRCSARSSVSCNCAVAARAGDDVFIIDRCNSLGDIKIWGPDKKVEYNLLRTRTISIDDTVAPNFKIFAVNGGREYMIYFPHGATVKAQLTGGGHAQFMNLWMTPSPADFNRTTGMCGNFNRDKKDDLVMRDGSLFTGHGSGHNQQPKEFSKHWRVQGNESIYNGNVPDTATTYKKQYCSCVKPTGTLSAEQYLDCQINSDALRCDQRGEDITNKNFEYSAGVPKNAKPFEFDPDWNPVEPTWPTPSGWTKAMATQFCEDFIKKSKAFLSCNDTFGLQDDVDMCVEDIRLSDGVEFAMSALDAYKQRCLNELSKYPDVPIPDDAFCINDCSGNGMCKNSECICSPGYAGEDCSLTKSQIPNVYFTPFCDVATQTCETADVYGDGFVQSRDLVCTFTPAEISEGELSLVGEEEEVQASYENFAEVKCPVGSTRAKRSTGGTPKAVQLALNVKNNPGAQASNVVVYTAYNSLCQTCDFSTGECTIKAGMCLIEGYCYKEGDDSPQDVEGTQPTCDPTHSQTSWRFPEQEPAVQEGLPGWAIGVIAASATLALVTFGIVLYMKLIRKREKVLA